MEAALDVVLAWWLLLDSALARKKRVLIDTTGAYTKIGIDHQLAGTCALTTLSPAFVQSIVALLPPLQGRVGHISP